MNKKFMIGMILGLFLISFVSAAWSTNTFNNSLASGNLVFTGNQNITRWLQVPQNNWVIDGFMNLSGSDLSSCYQESANVPNQTGLDGNCELNYSGVYDASITNYFYINYSKSSSVVEANWSIKHGTLSRYNVTIPSTCVTHYSDVLALRMFTNHPSSGGTGLSYGQCYNGTWNNITNIESSSSGFTYIGGNRVNLSDGDWNTFGGYLSNGAFTESTQGARAYLIYEEAIYWGIAPSNNPYLEVGSVDGIHEWNYTGEFNTTERTSNLYFQINNYLSSCTYVGGFCTVPFLFHSDTQGILQYSNMNFNGSGIQIESEEYETQVLEGDTSNFKITILSNEQLSSSNLIYNGTSYSGLFVSNPSNLGYNYTITITQTIPLVTVDENATFYWSFILADSSIENSTTHNQTILNFNLDSCSSFSNLIFNFTMVDEDSQVEINESTENTSAKIDLSIKDIGNQLTILNFSKLYNNTNPFAICSSVNLSNSEYRLDAVIQYSSTARFTEFYNIQNYKLNNQTEKTNITLYDLTTATGQEYKITYKDTNFNLVPGAVIQIQRKYIDEGVSKVVELPMVGGEGFAIAHLVSNDEIYNFVILQEGVVVATFEDIIAHCQNPTIEQCEININSFSSSVPLTSFSVSDDLSISLTYNKTTKVISSTFAISSGVPSLITLNATLYDGLGTTQICSDSLSSSGGTLSCTVPNSFGNSTIIIKLYRDGTVVKEAILRLGDDPLNIYGTNLIFLALIILVTLIGMGTTDNPNVLGLILVVGLILLVSLNIITSAGWVGAGATILWAVIAIIIMLIKGSRSQ